MAAELYLAEDALALHLLLQHLESFVLSRRPKRVLSAAKRGKQVLKSIH